LEEHTASIFRTEVRSILEEDGLYRVRRRIRPEGLAYHSHKIKKGHGGMSGPRGKIPFQGMREEGCIRRDRERERE
jgi:hypothetical protein